MAPSTIPFSTIPEIPFALRVVWFYLLVMTHTDSFSFQVDQWASLLDDLPLVSAEMHFKKNDKVCIRQVHQARSVPVSLAMLWSLIHSVILLSRLASCLGEHHLRHGIRRKQTWQTTETVNSENSWTSIHSEPEPQPHPRWCLFNRTPRK